VVVPRGRCARREQQQDEDEGDALHDWRAR
jgi:hypothetical protein